MKRSLNLLCIVVFSTSWGQKAAKPVTLFTAGGQEVLADEFIFLYNKNHRGKKEEFTEQKVLDYLTLFINFKLKIREAKTNGLDTTEGFHKEFNTYKEELKRPFLAEGNDLDRLVKEAYQRMTEEVNASHILITIKPNATPADTLEAFNTIAAIRQRAGRGEDFNQLARELSQDPSARSNGGNLGYFTVFGMVYPFETAAYQTKTGEVSSIVRTRFGYHILKVHDHRKAAGEVEVSHIMSRAVKGDLSQAKLHIMKAADQLKAGRPWEEVCKEFSEDAASKEQGGKLRPFGTGALAGSVPEFEKEAFSLQQPGEVSQPFSTNFGWHIVRLERKIPFPEFKDAEPNLKRRISRDERLQLAKAGRLEKMKRSYAYTESDAGMKVLMTLADSTLLKGRWKFNGDEVMASQELFSLGSHKFNIREFASFSEKKQTGSTLAPAAIMSQLFEKFVTQSLDEVEEEKLMADNPEYKSLVTEYREGILLFSIMEAEVWNRASSDSVGQRKFYEAHLDQYKAGERVEARLFSSADSTFLNEVKTKISRGDTLRPSDVKKFKAATNFRAFERGENKIIDMIPWAIGMHEKDADGLHYIVEVKRLIAPGQKSFEEARASVISDYQDELEKRWVASLRKKYPVQVNRGGKKLILKQLVAKS